VDQNGTQSFASKNNSMKAFGPFWGYVSVVMNWFNYIADNAVYPVLFMYYLEKLLKNYDWIQEPQYYYSIQFGLFALVFVLNLLGLFHLDLQVEDSFPVYSIPGVDLVGSASTLFAILILAPFFVMFIWAASTNNMVPKDILELPPV
jgi:hypothetical protein